MARGKSLQTQTLQGNEGFRSFTKNSTSVHRHAFGLVTGWPVWLRHAPRAPVQIMCSDGAMLAVKPWVEAKGAKFKNARPNVG